MYRANAPAANPEIYYRINLTRVFLDHATQHLNTRFQDEVLVCYKGLSIIPSALLTNNLQWKQNIQDFPNHYIQDMPNIAGIRAELTLWERKWNDAQARGDEIPDKISSAFKFVDKQSHPNIYFILQLLATLPITSASCERSISSLRNLKNYLRSTMVQDRLNELAMMHTHREKAIDLDKVIDLFAN